MRIIDLLQVNQDDLLKALTIKTIETAKQIFETPLTKLQCMNAKSSLSKFLY